MTTTDTVAIPGVNVTVAYSYINPTIVFSNGADEVTLTLDRDVTDDELNYLCVNLLVGARPSNAQVGAVDHVMDRHSMRFVHLGSVNSDDAPPADRARRAVRRLPGPVGHRLHHQEHPPRGVLPPGVHQPGRPVLAPRQPAAERSERACQGNKLPHRAPLPRQCPFYLSNVSSYYVI